MGSRGRLEHLDGLRGWAALVVVISHFRTNLGIPLLAHSGDPVASASAWASAALFFLQDGSLAVAIFFILSGIVLATAVDGAASRAHLQTELSGSPSLPPSFLGLVVKRYLRLTLPILASVLLAYLALAFFWTGADYQRLAEMTNFTTSAKTMTACAACTAPALTDALAQGLKSTLSFEIKFYNRVLWTIPWEMIGSLAIFALVLSLRRQFWRRWVNAILLFFLADTFLGLFLLGVLIYDLGLAGGAPARRPSPNGETPVFEIREGALRFAPIRLSAAWRRRLADAAGIALAAFGLAGLGFAAGVPALQAVVDRAASGLAAIGWGDAMSPHWSPTLVQAAAVVFGCCLSPALRKLLSMPASAFLGRVSFPLYLIHIPLMQMLVFPSFMFLREAGVEWNLAGLGLMAVAVPLILAASAPFHRFVELPSVRIAALAARPVDRAWNGVRIRAGEAGRALRLSFGAERSRI